MTENYIDEINYDKLVEKSLKNVMIDALKMVAKDGLPGEHHFYITFNTRCNGVNISDKLLEQYPEEMTIVIQHQYSNLRVEDDKFSIDLAFNGLNQTLVVPYSSVVYFADPHVKFGLKFELDDNNNESLSELDLEDDFSDNDDIAYQQASSGDNIVALDAFRKK